MVRVGSLRKGSPEVPGRCIVVDRTSPLGNPFFMADESKRDLVCDWYEKYFQDMIAWIEKDQGDMPIKTGFALRQLGMLLETAREQDIVLLCWCHPRRCHADTIAAWLNTQLGG